MRWSGVIANAFDGLRFLRKSTVLWANMLFYVPTVTILQEGTPTEMTARVFGARIALTNLSWVPAIFLGGVLSDSIGVDVLLILAGSLTLATALVGAFLSVIR